MDIEMYSHLYSSFIILMTKSPILTPIKQHTFIQHFNYLIPTAYSESPVNLMDVFVP